MSDDRTPLPDDFGDSVFATVADLEALADAARRDRIEAGHSADLAFTCMCMAAGVVLFDLVYTFCK